MEYPMLCNWLVFKRLDGQRYEVRDCLCECSYIMSSRLAGFARRLDGHTDPYKISRSFSQPQVEAMLDALEEEELLRHSRSLDVEEGTFLYTLIIPRVTKAMRHFSRMANALLLLSWLPVLAAGLVLCARSWPDMDMEYFYTGNILGTLAGIFLHELGHAAATLACGGKLFEIGVMLHLILPGAYVLSDMEEIDSRLCRAQADAAGVEVNLLLTGLSLIAAALAPFGNGLFFGAAIANGALAITNLTFGSGLDGMHLIGELIGYRELAGVAKNTAESRKMRRELWKKGLNGKATIAAAYLLAGMQCVLPLLIVMEIVEVILCAAA